MRYVKILTQREREREKRERERERERERSHINIYRPHVDSASSSNKSRVQEDDIP